MNWKRAKRDIEKVLEEGKGRGNSIVIIERSRINNF